MKLLLELEENEQILFPSWRKKRRGVLLRRDCSLRGGRWWETSLTQGEGDTSWIRHRYHERRCCRTNKTPCGNIGIAFVFNDYTCCWLDEGLVRCDLGVAMESNNKLAYWLPSAMVSLYDRPFTVARRMIRLIWTWSASWYD